MTASPWPNPDPPPGALNADLESRAPELVTVRDGDPLATLSVVINVEAKTLAISNLVANARSKTAGDVVADLLRGTARTRTAATVWAFEAISRSPHKAGMPELTLDDDEWYALVVNRNRKVRQFQESKSAPRRRLRS